MMRSIVVPVCVLFVLTLAGCLKPSAEPAKPSTFVFQDFEQAKITATECSRQRWMPNELTLGKIGFEPSNASAVQVPKACDIKLAKPGDFVAVPFYGCTVPEQGSVIFLTLEERVYAMQCIWTNKQTLGYVDAMVATDVRPFPEPPMAQPVALARPKDAISIKSAPISRPASTSKLICPSAEGAKQAAYDFDLAQTPKQSLTIWTLNKPGTPAAEFTVTVPKGIDFTKIALNKFLGLPFIPGDTLNALKSGDNVLIRDAMMTYVSARIVAVEQGALRKHRVLVLNHLALESPQ